ncbi:unnamed protein product [Protopolystoma xenopodis]|uniref:Uncharacterized protein n=1 Tax=Protopolystoma xenopodis TaxID=117903 RepID=A0A3S5CVC0_9PLAT|nr:unnamed protein product [Protopolystoma xenopodis]
MDNFYGISLNGLCLDRLIIRDCSFSMQALFGLVRWFRYLLAFDLAFPFESILSARVKALAQLRNSLPLPTPTSTQKIVADSSEPEPTSCLSENTTSTLSHTPDEPGITLELSDQEDPALKFSLPNGHTEFTKDPVSSHSIDYTVRVSSSSASGSFGTANIAKRTTNSGCHGGSLVSSRGSSMRSLLPRCPRLFSGESSTHKFYFLALFAL